MACRTVVSSVFLMEPWRPLHPNCSFAASSSSSFTVVFAPLTLSLRCGIRSYVVQGFRKGRGVHLNCSIGETPSSSSSQDDQGPPQEAVLKAISEVSKTEGRVGQTTNVVIGGTVTDDSTSEWVSLDQKVNSYPTVRGFTAIGTGGDDFVHAMVIAVESVLQQPIPEGRVKQKLSSRGKYVSVNIGPVKVVSSEQVQAVYNAMRRDDRMKYFLNFSIPLLGLWQASDSILVILIQFSDQHEYEYEYCKRIARPSFSSVMEERQLNGELNPNPKNNNNDKEKKEKKKRKQDFEFCKVCNLNHDQGRRHNYFPNHIKSLSSFLSRFLKKMSDVRFFLKNPLFLRPEHAGRNRLWCVFCDCDVQELDSPFACSNAITHLASFEHLKNLKHFLWKYGGGEDRVDAFRISEADLSKWVKRCESLRSSAASPIEGSYELSRDIQNKLSSENMHNFEKKSIISFKSSFSNNVLPLQSSTDERCHIFHPETTKVARPLLPDSTSLPVDKQGKMHSQGMHVTKNMTMDLKVYRNSQHPLVHSCNGGSVGCSSSNGVVYQFESMDKGGSSNQGVQNLTSVSQLLAEEPKGNVHSGAPPPWFEEKNEDNQLNVELSTGFCISSLPSPLEKFGKTRKLNPKRVGAAWAEKRKIELEKEKRGEIDSGNCDTDWLPNFGRVWQSGSRKESRKEFEKEKEKLLKVDSLTETTTKIRPYISKRLTDADASNFSADKSS
ncbi:hypothetical protein NE237_021744 [Protea cynaroides]|uniref:Uncharacterized protein n=2 Tax=Magnoliopsida TaxID=3398 RepID=A0A9Q0K2W4_9MAGN|nr:hypothetical protein NE237_021744 [Protea cynaroides]